MSKLEDIIRQRILILDGGLGTMVQGFGLEEKDYRGDRFSNWPIPLNGCNDVLVLTSPDVIARIHEQYLKAGADIISTDTFNANRISMSDYGLEGHVYEINLQAARLARGVAGKFTADEPAKPRFVGGSIGPTSRTASMSADVNDPASRDVNFEDLVGAYAEQVQGLLDGGVDMLMLETVFDTLNVKAGIFAIEQECDKRGIKIPLMISGTLADTSGRMLSGQTVEAFYASVEHAAPFAIGFNCAYGAKQLGPFLERLSAISRFPVSAYPNAGLPNVMGGYDETAEMMAEDVREYMENGWVNIIGGCCGTTPDHIRALAQLASEYGPRIAAPDPHDTVLSGLEPLVIRPETNFVNIGERANVAGSAKFARLIREGDYEQAVSIVRQQVDSGAQIVDVCMDDGMIDGPRAMEHFLRLCMSEPEIARVPFMVDSSLWEVLETGLRNLQGKSLVNSISLKEGEQEFLRKANLIHAYGAAAVVMLFDETGQADSYQRKIEVAERAYRLLTDSGFPPQDIVFDPNVLAIATGIEEHNTYGLDFIEACRWIKNNLPYCKVSGGVSNLSFSFRGNNRIREAMHSVFLYHAVSAGMDMGIVNPAMLQVYSDIEPELLELTENVVLNRRPDAAERLSEYAERTAGDLAAKTDSRQDAWRSATVTERISHAMLKGITDHIETDIMEAYNELGVPLKVIDNMLMPAMETIGQLFSEGKMFLPQVVKSARVMKKAVSVLTPFIEEGQQEGSSDTGKVLIATVKGDVHDIGKNIVSVVMSCNGYKVTDLGVMVDTQVIVDKAVETSSQVIGLSGLISPSLEEMVKVVMELEKRGLDIPVIIGGATTSALHTAVKIAPHYSGPVIHSNDASENITILNNLFGENREQFLVGHREKQEALRVSYENKNSPRSYISLEESRSNKYFKDKDDITVPAATGKVDLLDYPIGLVEELIDWNFFFPAWEIKGKYPEILGSRDKGEQARKLMDDATSLIKLFSGNGQLKLNGVAAVFPAYSDNDSIFITDNEGKTWCLPQLRNQQAGMAENLCLSDFIAAKGSGNEDYVGLFSVTAGIGLDRVIEGYRNAGDDYNAIMSKLVADRLAEAFAETVHKLIRTQFWGVDESLTAQDILQGKYRGIRVAFGYPACPDHSLKKDVMDILDPQRITSMEITDNYMIYPGETVCGMVFFGKQDKYFDVGKIDTVQLQDYASRRGMDAGEIARLIPRHIR